MQRSLRQWEYDPKRLTLTHRGQKYEIDLEEITTSAQMLDWIMQVASKTWADAETVAELVRALNILLDPQRTLCSGGKERGPITPREVIRGKQI